MEYSFELQLIVIIIGWVVFAAAPMLLSERAERIEVKEIMKTGGLAEAEILEYIDNYDFISVKYSFTPKGHTQPITCIRALASRKIKLPVGSKVPVRYKMSHPFMSVLVPYADIMAAI